MNETLSTALYIILGILLAFGINQGLALALSTDIPVVAVESNSMVPTFYKGDILILQGVPADDLVIGDVIVFSPEGHSIPVVHRIVEINGDGTFQTKGDANSNQLSFEKSIAENQIHGKQIVIVPYLGWVKIATVEYVLPNLSMFAFLIVIVIIGYYTLNNKLGKKRRVGKKL